MADKKYKNVHRFIHSREEHGFYSRKNEKSMSSSQFGFKIWELNLRRAGRSLRQALRDEVVSGFPDKSNERSDGISQSSGIAILLMALHDKSSVDNSFRWDNWSASLKHRKGTYLREVFTRDVFYGVARKIDVRK